MKSSIGRIEYAREYERHEDKGREMNPKKVCFPPDNVPKGHLGVLTDLEFENWAMN